MAKAILEGYPEVAQFVRPVAETNDTADVHVSITATRIIDFAEKGGFTGYGTLTIVGFFSLVSHKSLSHDLCNFRLEIGGQSLCVYPTGPMMLSDFSTVQCLKFI